MTPPISQSSPPSNSIGVSIQGIGSCVPETVISNDDLTRLVETSDEWIASRTGIRNRRVVSGNDRVADLAIHAASQPWSVPAYPGKLWIW